MESDLSELPKTEVRKLISNLENIIEVEGRGYAAEKGKKWAYGTVMFGIVCVPVAIFGGGYFAFDYILENVPNRDKVFAAAATILAGTIAAVSLFDPLYQMFNDSLRGFRRSRKQQERHYQEVNRLVKELEECSQYA